MRDWWPRIIILVLLAVVLGVPFAFKPVRQTGAAPVRRAQDQKKLIIFSPHNEQIRYEFERAFSEMRAARGKSPVDIDWRSGGGTSDLRKQVLDQFAAKAKAGNENEGIGADLFFGGGEFEHNKLAQGVTVTRGGKPVRVPITIEIELPDQMLEQVFPQPTIGGEKLYDPNRHWIGAALSSFGIVYNRDVLGMLRVAEPKTWEDLQNPRYRGWIALADPAHSGSIAATYNVILRRMGWTEGWRTLRRVFANSRYFTAGAGKVPVDVSAGEAAAGMCIDFYGRFQAGAIGGDRIGYVDPPGMTAITADPISILRGAPQEALALEFVVWLLSPEAQGLWQRKRQTTGGPQKYELRRLPIRSDLYTQQEMAHWTDQVNPFDIARPVPEGMPDFYTAVAPVAHAMAIDILEDLRAAWDAIIEHPGHPNINRMKALFHQMPDELTVSRPPDLASVWQEALGDTNHPRHQGVTQSLSAFQRQLFARWKDSDQKLKDRIRWTRYFRGNYRKIVDLAKDD